MDQKQQLTKKVIIQSSNKNARENKGWQQSEKYQNCLKKEKWKRGNPEVTKKEDRWREQRGQRGREAETERETDGSREEADRNSLGGQHWLSSRGTAGSMES